MIHQITAHIATFGIPWNRLQVIRTAQTVVIHVWGHGGWMGAIRAETEADAWTELKSQIPQKPMDQFTEILTRVAEATARHKTFLDAEEANRKKEVAAILFNMRLSFVKPISMRSLKDGADLLAARLSGLMNPDELEDMRQRLHRAADSLPSMPDREVVAARAEAMLHLLETIYRS